MRNIKQVMRVARKVLEYTSHSLLVGEKATQFAVKMGFKEETLSTEHSLEMWQEWKDNNCQPNFWKVFLPAIFTQIYVNLFRICQTRPSSVDHTIQPEYMKNLTRSSTETRWSGDQRTMTPSACSPLIGTGTLLPELQPTEQNIKFQGKFWGIM